MYLCYVDESGNPGLNDADSRHLLLGAAVLFEDKWRQLRGDTTTLISQYFPTNPPAEIHCAELRGGRGRFSKLAKPDRLGMLQAFGGVVSSYLPSELRLFTVVVDKRDWASRHPNRTGNDLYLAAFEQLVSRFDLFLRRRSREGCPSKGLMIVDPCNSGLTGALKLALGRFQAGGTQWRNVENVIETVMFLLSHESPGLQVADLCSYAVWRLIEYGDDSLVLSLRTVFDREPRSSATPPGRWHGVKYMGSDQSIDARLSNIWPLT